MYFVSNNKSSGHSCARITWFIALSLIVSTLTVEAQNLNSPNKVGPLGIQVNTMSGNVYITRTDIHIPARGFKLKVKFYYNSFLFTENYGYGNGWRFEYDIRYQVDTTPGARLILWKDGREDKYDSIPGGGYKSPRGFYSKLLQYQPGKYVLTEPDSTQLFFDNASHKRLTRITEPNGNYINLNYTDSLLTSLTNTAGQTISFTYNNNGRLATVVDAIAIPSRTYTYSYDAVGNLIEVKDPLNGKCKYGYLVNGPMKSLTDKNNNKVDIIYFPDLTARELIGCNKRLGFSYDSSSNKTIVVDHLATGNQVTTYTYERLDNLFWITSMKGNCCGFNISYDYDDQGNAIKMTDANGQTYAYTYDAFGNMLTRTDPLNQTSTYTYTNDFNKISSYKDPKGILYTLGYDARGNFTQLIMPGNAVYTATYNAQGDIISSTDPKGNVYTYNYDAYGNPSTVTGPGGYTATLVHDARGNLLSYTDARGNQSTAEFDILSRLKKIIDPYNNNFQLGYDAQGNVTSVVSKNNETSIFNYDASNRVVKVTGPTNRQVTFTYDGMDNLTGIQAPHGYARKFSHDTRNRLNGEKDSENNNTAYTYDGNGNITSATLPNGQTINYSYDALNRLILVSDATGNIVSLAYDKNNNVVSYTNGTGAITSVTYDSLNRIKQVTDPLGYSTSYIYDKNNNVTSVTDREGKVSTYAYDSLNRIKSFTDNNNHTVTTTYDAIGNIIQLRDQNNNITNYTYDSLNRRKRMTYPDGKYQEFSYDNKSNIIGNRLTDGTIITYQYDTLNRVKNKTLPNGEVFSYTYDDLGRIITATNSSGTITIAYDALNRVVAETFDGRTTRYNYSISGRTQTIIYPDSTIVTRQFDTRNRLIKILKDNVTIAEYSYNNENQLTGKTFGNGVSTIMQYDFANRLSSIVTSAGMQNSSFTYDKERNKTAINRLNNPSLSEQFTYDNGYRLTNYKKGPVGSPVIQNTYTYDAVGNRTAANLNGSATSYTTNNLNQLTGINSTVFTFDDRGNITYDGLFYKTYDAENRLKKDSASPDNVVLYSYDAMNRRSAKSVNGNVFKYTYSGVVPIEERSNSNSLLNRTIFSNFLSPVMNEKNGNAFYYHSNELKSVEAISNSNGRMIESYSYDVYGKLSRYDSLNNPLASSIAGNRFGFTGQEFDSATNSYGFFYRNYSPERGIFNQRDLIEYEDGMGMYQYMGNNPANGIDIWGLKPCPGDDKMDVVKSAGYASASVAFLNWVGTKTGKIVANNPYISAPLVPVNIVVNLKNTVDYGTGFDSRTGTQNAEGAFDLAVGYTGAAAGTVSAVGGAEIALTTMAAGGGEIAAGSTLVSAGTLAAAGTVTAVVVTIVVTDVVSQKVFNHTQNVKWDAIAQQSEIDAQNYQFGRSREYGRQWVGVQEAMRRTQEENDCPDGGNQKRYKWYYDPVTGTFHRRPFDPNEIIGPDGQPDKAWVSVNDRLPYTINFENDTSATAPAKFVRITTPIEPKQEANTFELGSFGFNNQSFEIPPGQASYYQRLDCRDSMNLYVDVVAGYDPVRHEGFWEFQSIDPITLLPSEEPLAGFLFLQDTTQPNYGKGFVNFSIKPKTNAQTLDTIGARAFIVFDQNDTIPTNIHSNTIDAVAPVSSITGLPDLTPDTEVSLTYTGTDDPNGSGVKWYSIYVADDNGPPELYLSNITVTDTVFSGIAEHTYKFYITATDTAGNVEELRLLDSVKITNGQYIICPGDNVNFDSKMTGSSFQWQVDNGTGYTNVTNGGVYSGATTAILNLTNPPTSMYGYRFRCLVNGTDYSLEFILKFGMTWEGTVSTAWENPANWSCIVLPDMNTDVIINGGKVNYPVINSNPTVRTLRLNPGATGTVNTGFTLTVVK